MFYTFLSAASCASPDNAADFQIGGTYEKKGNHLLYGSADLYISVTGGPCSRPGRGRSKDCSLVLCGMVRDGGSHQYGQNSDTGKTRL